MRTRSTRGRASCGWALFFVVVGCGASSQSSDGSSSSDAGDASISACSSLPPVYPRLEAVSGTLGAYDGPAIVERSVGGEIILAVAAPAADGGVGQDGGAAELERVEVSGLDASQTLPVGAEVWLSKAQNPPQGLAAPPPSSFAVRTRQGGPLLFGAARNAFTAASSPVAVGEIREICTTPSPDTCAPTGSTLTYSEVTVLGDSPVVIRDGAIGEISVGGLRYDVRVKAQTTKEGHGSTSCADDFPFDGVELDVRAKDLGALAVDLTVGPGPACGQGNAAVPEVAFAIRGANGGLQNPIESRATYAGRSPLAAETYIYDIDGTSPTPGAAPPQLEIGGGASVLPEPTIGQAFWLSSGSSSDSAIALRESQGGPILIAQATGTPTRGPLMQLGSMLGVGVALEKTCSYGPAYDLWTASFATTPPISLPSGTTATLAIGGHSYHAWMWNETDFSLVMVRAD